MSGNLTSLRDRRRAETIREIKAAALAETSAHGPDGLSLRAVARAVGVSVQALYHYFPSRDALVTALVTDTFTELAATVAGAADAARADGSPPAVAAGLAYRRWALERRSAFLLALGVPLPDYRAPEDGPTTPAAAGLGRAFAGAVFGSHPQELLARIPAPAAGGPQHPVFDLPPGALALFTTGWARLHGFVVLELLGHIPWVEGAGEPACRLLLEGYVTEVERALTAARRA